MNEHYDDLESIRAAGYALVDEAVRHIDRTADSAVTTPLRPRDLAKAFATPPGRKGKPLDEVIDALRGSVIDESIRLAHPMYMGHQVCPPLPVAALADSVISMLNQSMAVWEMSPAARMVEIHLIRWFASLASFGQDAGGSFVSGGAAGNLTALLAARANRFPDAWKHGNPPGLAVVTGQQAHYSISRAAGIMGLGSDAAIEIPTTPVGTTDPRAAAEALDALAAEGRPVLALVGTAGSTPTGSFDDLSALAEICAARGVWFHVDGAHGASALLSATHRHRLAGIERADSLTWDPHKMMFQPLSSALVLVRNRRALEGAFQQNAPYLFHPGGEMEAPPDSGPWTLQCSRRADPVRLWVALEYYGTDTLAELFDYTVSLAGALYERIENAPDFEALHEPQSNILCFRYRPDGLDDAEIDAFQDRLRARYNASGRGWITATTLNGQRTLRVTLINPRTRAEHLDRLLEGLREEAAALLITQ